MICTDNKQNWVSMVPLSKPLLSPELPVLLSPDLARGKGGFRDKWFDWVTLWTKTFKLFYYPTLLSFLGISIGCSLLRLHSIRTPTNLPKEKSWVIERIFGKDLHNEMCTSGQNVTSGLTSIWYNLLRFVGVLIKQF